MVEGMDEQIENKKMKRGMRKGRRGRVEEREKVDAKEE
jgi:hypothetical protein